MTIVPTRLRIAMTKNIHNGVVEFVLSHDFKQQLMSSLMKVM